MASSALLWELVKSSNAYITRNINGTIWSKEPGNLYGKSSYKYSGLANRASTLHIAEVEGVVALSTSSKKSPGKLVTSLVKKNARRTNHAAAAVADSIRPDLKAAARARASALSRALRKRRVSVELNA